MTRASVVTSVLVCMMSLAVWSASAIAQQAQPQAKKMTSDYIQKAAVGNLFEIQSSELALKQAADANVKAFAQRMIGDHTTANEALKAGVQSANLQIKVPEKVDKAHEAKLNELRKVKGRDFDAEYMSEQVDAHKDALDLHQSYADKGDNPVLQKTAANTATIVERHLQAAQEIVKKMPAKGSSTGGGRY